MADLSPETRDAVREGCKRSAATVLPLVLDYLGGADAILDVGAGEGHWGIEADRLGAPWVRMVDVAPQVGYWNDEHGAHHYEIEAWDAEARDSLPDRITRDGWVRWSLALCLEMAEHVSPQAGDHLVSELCRVADAVLWSAAIPGQGGDGHVNEQWVEYWDERFDRHGWTLTDPGWRDALWNDPRCEPWYAAGILLAIPGDLPTPLNRVHPITFAHHCGVPAPSA